MTDPSPDYGYTDAELWEEIARLREFGEHYSGAAQEAWDRIEVLEKALRGLMFKSGCWCVNPDSAEGHEIACKAAHHALGDKT